MNECRGELLTRVRRGLGTDQDRIALDTHLERCASCALSQDVGDDFKAAGLAGSGDAELVLRLAERLSSDREVMTKARDTAPRSASLRIAPPATSVNPERSSPSISPPFRRRAVFVLGAALLFGSAAAASHYYFRVGAEAKTAPSLPPPASAKVREDARGKKVPSVSSTKSSDTSPRHEASPVTTELRPMVKASAERSPHATPRARPAAASSADLYRKANEARRNGSNAEAISLYRSLQRHHPATSEANLSRVSLGGLLLEVGAGRDALHQYDAYLASGDARLAAEALYGRGKCLSRLGRAAEELETWRKMLTTYPSSAYATHAQKRILELGD